MCRVTNEDGAGTQPWPRVGPECQAACRTDGSRRREPCCALVSQQASRRIAPAAGGGRWYKLPAVLKGQLGVPALWKHPRAGLRVKPKLLYGMSAISRFQTFYERLEWGTGVTEWNVHCRGLKASPLPVSEVNGPASLEGLMQWGGGGERGMPCEFSHLAAISAATSSAVRYMPLKVSCRQQRRASCASSLATRLVVRSSLACTLSLIVLKSTWI